MLPQVPIWLCLKMQMLHADLLDYLWLGIILKIMAVFHIVLLDLHVIQKACLTKGFQVRLCYRSKYFHVFCL